MKQDQELNLISRMAGNIFSKGAATPKEAAKFALEIYLEVQKQIKEKIENKKVK